MPWGVRAVASPGGRPRQGRVWRAADRRQPRGDPEGFRGSGGLSEVAHEWYTWQDMPLAVDTRAPVSIVSEALTSRAVGRTTGE